MIHSLYVNTNVDCPLRCHFCPQEGFLAAYNNRPRMMTFEVFQRCIDKVPPRLMIEFSGFSDPYINPECSKMLTYVSQAGHGIDVYTTLRFCTEADLDAMEAVSIPRKCHLNVHVPDQKNYTRFAVDVSYIKLVDRARKLGARIVAHAEVHPCLMPAEVIPIHDCAGNLADLTVPHRTLSGNVTCEFSAGSFNRPVLLPDGTVVLCCEDWGMRHILGNLLDQSYAEVVNSHEKMRLRKALTTNCDALCRHCVYGKQL